MFRSRRAGAFAICVLLAVIHTWPLALHPARYSRNDNADAQLNEWILAWIPHQLVHNPVHLFEGNIFYPAHDTLAFSEPLIVPALMGAPIGWLGASPVLVYNLVLIAGFALTAFAMFWLVESWTGSIAAGLGAGSLFALNTHTLTRLAHVQASHIYGLPIAMLAVDRIVLSRGGSRRDALLLAAALAILAYTSGYLIVFAIVMLALVVVTRAPDWWPRRRQAVPSLALAAVVAGAALVPIYIPYHRVATEQHMTRPLDVIQDYSATPRGYLATSGRLHLMTWSARFFKDPVDSFFPGVAILVLAVMGAAGAMRRRTNPDDPMPSRVVMLLVIGAAGMILSFGTATPIYGWLFHVFPPMQSLRAAARFGNLFLFAVAVLGGLGMTMVRRRWLAIALVVVVNVETLRAPITYRAFDGIPALYQVLAHEPSPVVVVEQPFFPRWAVFENGPYVLNSTAYWRPLMNGYSGFTPEGYQRYADTFWYFPEERAIQAMKDAGVTHVVVHPSGFLTNRKPVIEVLDQRSDFELLGIGPDGIRLYRLTR